MFTWEGPEGGGGVKVAGVQGAGGEGACGCRGACGGDEGGACRGGLSATETYITAMSTWPWPATLAPPGGKG